MIKIKSIICAAVIASSIILYCAESYARDQIRMVGSSTVYPFATVVAEEFGNKGGFATPIVESTGTGGGFKLFCSGIGEGYPDFANASRAIKDSEVRKCAENGIKDITALKIGYDGIVIANSVRAKRYDLTKTHLFKALAKKIPVKGQLVNNFYKTWKEIDTSLPDMKIEVYGPPPTSGTRDAFAELVMEEACISLPEFKDAYPDKKARKKYCHLIREDGIYIETGENDNLIVQKLNANENALGIFGFSFLEENGEVVQGSLIEGVEPVFENISSGAYPVCRPLFIYAKNAHIPLINGMKEFVKEIANENAIGEEGYLIEKGLIPLGRGELGEIHKAVSALN